MDRGAFTRQPPEGWLRHLRALCDADGPIILLDDGSWGSDYLLQALAEEDRPLIRLELDAGDRDDPVSQGNKLADAVTRALGSPLFGYGMPYGYGLNVLAAHQSLLEPFSFALAGAEHGLDFARKLLSLHRGQSRVIVQFGVPHPAFVLPETARLLGPDRLRLGLEEALLLAGDGLPRALVAALLKSSNGALEPFLLELAKARGVPSPPQPSAAGFCPTPAAGEPLEPVTLLRILLEQGRFMRALELAAEQSPENVATVLEHGKNHFWSRGDHARMHRLLSRLPEGPVHSETVLLWRLASALEPRPPDLGRGRQGGGASG
jgi:hypothetical protein